MSSIFGTDIGILSEFEKSIIWLATECRRGKTKVRLSVRSNGAKVQYSFGMNLKSIEIVTEAFNDFGERSEYVFSVENSLEGRIISSLASDWDEITKESKENEDALRWVKSAPGIIQFSKKSREEIKELVPDGVISKYTVYDN